ncbi:metallocarboxypeptidase ECM14 [Lecanosticta acicola]|uniref:Inactive metallocarboxypeptidase ECM14 n=1 Tax=Lecanosticta acicola TaxID=111012 RepID=A0AAI8YY74_9PEZI|nr:metallocarboxypeptidase ECM14 [Lecanosticta acicola]
MKFPSSTLVVLPALLSAFVAAVPSPAAFDQRPFQNTHSDRLQPSPWYNVPGRLVEWFRGRHKPCHASSNKAESLPPAHTFTRYTGDLVLRFNISTQDEAASLAEAADTLLLDVWEFAQNWVDIRLSKESVPLLLGLLPSSLQNSHTPLLREKALAQAIFDNYQKHNAPSLTTSPSHLPTRRPFSPHLEQATGAESNLFFADYQPFTVIEPWLRLLASLFTTHVRHINIGLTYEGRNIPALRVGAHPTNREDPNPPKRKTILVMGGLHAREWISTTTVNYIAYSLITGYGKNQLITRLLESFDFVFIPTLNPDGYIYTWETDRLWRKNRQQTGIRFCQGIDLDRSFGFEWSTTDNPCSESFSGDTPFDAVESRRLSEWAKAETENNNVDFVGFLDLHSYSQEILYPYSYSCTDTPPGLENLEELAFGMGKAIRITQGHGYEIMPACEGNVAASSSSKGARQHLLPRMELSGGSALDYFYGNMSVRYAYQIKLRDRGTYGFLLPKDHIIPTGKEILNAVLYFGGFLGEIYDTDAFKEVTLTKPAEMETLESEDVQKDDLTAAVAEDVEEMMIVEDEERAIVVEDLLDPAEVNWELKRRRRR